MSALTTCAMIERDTIERDPGEWKAGELVSNTYELRSIIGAGGMGRVYEAHDRFLKRTVAIKAARHGARQPLEAPLVKEAEALASIQHPNLPLVHAVGVHQDVPYVVMELLRGVSLAQHLDSLVKLGKRFTITEVIDILIALTDALAAVHLAGIAHRDVKPANVMLAPRNRVVLMDLGIFLAECSTQPAPFAGTPQYMAPELIRGTVQPGLAHLVDLYALGILAYELLALRVPFDASTNVAVLNHHLFDPVPSILKARPDTPPALAALVESLVAKKALDRPQSAESVLWALRALRREPPTPTTPFSVLIVDDDPDIRELMRACVQRSVEGVEVHAAADGRRALQVVRERDISLMLLDLQLPGGMNGIELCMFLRGTRLAERTTIVSVSGEAGERDLGLLRQLGVSHFVPKGPRLSGELQTLIRSLAMARRQALAPR
jgi:eukaryotic-like serine/threonine-protein kinase